jgi:hypothetical protein
MDVKGGSAFGAEYYFTVTVKLNSSSGMPSGRLRSDRKEAGRRMSEALHEPFSPILWEPALNLLIVRGTEGGHLTICCT